MNQANPKDSPQERLIHYLEMATKSHEAARNPAADLQVRNLYSWVAKSWEMLAMDELDKMRKGSRSEHARRRQRIPSVSSHSRNESQTRFPGSQRVLDWD
jgi:hypothetical protein